MDIYKWYNEVKNQNWQNTFENFFLFFVKLGIYNFILVNKNIC
jgi:hypothetical protein